MRIPEIVLAAASLELHVRTAVPGLARVLDRYLRDLVARLPRQGSRLQRVHDAIARSMHGGRASLRATARQLLASARTVQRWLKELGVTHRELVEDLRRDLADRLLSTARLSIAEIASLIGFHDVSGFRRAYKRWTGAAPSRRRGR
jgi:AraC-like DNA-binding protein